MRSLAIRGLDAVQIGSSVPTEMVVSQNVGFVMERRSVETGPTKGIASIRNVRKTISNATMVSVYQVSIFKMKLNYSLSSQFTSFNQLTHLIITRNLEVRPAI